MKTLNDHVAVAPFVFEHNKGHNVSTIKGFSGTEKSLRTLVSTTVIFDSDKFKAGQKLYFHAETAALPQNKKVLSLPKDGKDVEFILIPEVMAVGVEG